MKIKKAVARTAREAMRRRESGVDLVNMVVVETGGGGDGGGGGGGLCLISSAQVFSGQTTHPAGQGAAVQ